MSKFISVLTWVIVFNLLMGCHCNGASYPYSSKGKRDDQACKLKIPLKGSLQNAVWSPGADAIVFTLFKGGYNKGPADLVIYNLKSGVTKTLVSDNSDNINLPGSAWNGLTRQIIFSSSREPHDEIFVISEDGKSGKEKKITDRINRVAYEPSFSPDGKWVVFESHNLDVEGNGIITKYKIDRAGPYQILTGTDDDCRQPNWSPDGRHIVYQRFENGQWDLWVMDTDGKNQRQITWGAGDKTDASFSPDSQWVVYSADGPTLKFANLYIISVSCGDPVRVTHFDGYDGAPSWSPDGCKIAFESSPGDPEETFGTMIWVIDISSKSAIMH